MARRRERPKVSAGRRTKEHEESFTTKTIKMPEGLSFYKVKTGVKRLDIIPFKVGKGNPFADPGTIHFERTYWVHRNVGANNDTYCCPAKMAVGSPIALA